MTNESTLDIGAALKRARTQRGLSLESVQQKTRIPRKFLESLEGNRFQELPATVYLRGFLRTYCEFLDIDFESMWSHFSEPAPKPQPAGSPSPIESPRTPAAPSVPPAALAAAAVAVVALCALALRFGRPKAPAAAPAPPPAAAPSALAPLHPKNEMTLELYFPTRTWIRLESDGRLRFEGWAPAGKKQSWTAMDRFRIRTNDPDNVRTVWNGKSATLSSFPRLPGGEFAIEAPAQ